MALAEREVRPAPDMSGWSQEQKVLYALIRLEGTKVGVVAEAVGKSHSAISQYVSGTYASPRKLDVDIRKYLIGIGRWQEEEERYLVEDTPESTAEYTRPIFVSTRDSARILGVCRRCWEQHEMGMITGDPGTGKTYTFEQLPAESALPYIVVSCDQTSSKKSVLVDTCEALELPARGASPTLLRRIVKYLRDCPHLLIYDEADLLKGLEVYETIRAIHDKAGVGVVLCGNNNLAERILMYAEDRPELARLRDRIGYYQRLTGLSAEEAERFAAGLNATAGAREMLVTIGTNRGIRQLTMGIARCLDATGGDRITEELVEQLGSIVLSFNA